MQSRHEIIKDDIMQKIGLERKTTLARMFLVCIYVVFFLLLLYRSFLSVELTDEIHGIASIYNIYKGQTPFMTSWDYHTGWCLEAPLFALYALVSPELEGIVLFFRLAYIFFVGANLTLITYLMQKHFHNKDICFYIFPTLFYVSFSLFQISYNSFTVNILLLASTLLFVREKEQLCCFASGILMCLVCISYPTFLILAVFLAVFILLADRGEARYRKAMWYILSGTITACIFFLWLFSRGSMELLNSGLKGMFSSPHETGKGGMNALFLIKTFYEPIRTYFTAVSEKLPGFYIVFFIIIVLMVKNKKKFWNSFLLLAFLVVNTYISINSIGHLIVGDFAAFIIFIGFSDKRVWKKYLIFWVVVISFILTYCFTSDNCDIFTAFGAAGQMVFFLIGIILSDREIVPHKGVAILIMMILSVSAMLYVYTYVYRDEPVKELSVRVEDGIYKGLYTTQGRKQFVEKAEKMLKEEINIEDQICVVTRAPMVYLMANANICAPQTWDAQFLYRGYTSAAPLLDYFEIVKKVPDVLVATDMDIKDFYNNSKYEINEFINRNYELYHEEEIEGVTFYLWRRKES